MHAFLEATWFLWWILTVIGVLRWFHNASQFEERINQTDRKKICDMPGFEAGPRESQPASRAS